MFAAILIVATITGLFQETSSEKIAQSASIFRIINGNTVPLGEIPYQVSLQTKANGYHICGGTIITENYVLTAAHCISSYRPAYNYKAHDVRVVVGTVDLWYPAAVHDVSRAILHENYAAPTWDNDIALLEVDRPFEFDENVAPARLPPHSADERYSFVTEAVVSGYGKTESVDQSPKLLRANVLIVNRTQCEAAYANWRKYPVRSTNICSKGIDDEQGFCNGDSGGPLSIDGTAVGIVSWSLNGGCYQSGQVQVYTRISSYIDWISRQIRKRISCSFVGNRRYLSDEL